MLKNDDLILQGIYALMYDAVMISGTIISDLIAKNQWNKTEGNFLENGKQRGKRSVAFIKALQEVRKCKQIYSSTLSCFDLLIMLSIHCLFLQFVDLYVHYLMNMFKVI